MPRNVTLFTVVPYDDSNEENLQELLENVTDLVSDVTRLTQGLKDVVEREATNVSASLSKSLTTDTSTNIVCSCASCCSARNKTGFSRTVKPQDVSVNLARNDTNNGRVPAGSSLRCKDPKCPAEASKVPRAFNCEDPKCPVGSSPVPRPVKCEDPKCPVGSPPVKCEDPKCPAPRPLTCEELKCGPIKEEVEEKIETEQEEGKDEKIEEEKTPLEENLETCVKSRTKTKIPTRSSVTKNSAKLLGPAKVKTVIRHGSEPVLIE